MVYVMSVATPKTPPSPVIPTPSVSPPIRVPELKTKVIYQDDNNGYQIFSYPDAGETWLLIMGSPFEKYRQLAEKKFLQESKLSPTEACKLTVKITTPYYANPEEADQFYKPSFCK